MKIKEIFKAASVTFKQYRSLLLTFAFTWAIIVGVPYALLYLFVGSGFAILAAIIIFLTLQVSFGIIAIKAVNRREVQMNDFYTGFKSFYSSIFLEAKVMLKGIVFALLGLVIGAFVGGLILSFVISSKEPAIIDSYLASGDINAFATQLNSIPWVLTGLDYVYAFSYLVGALFMVRYGMSKSFAPYVCFETRFSIGNAIELSEKFLVPNRKSYHRFNLVFVLMMIPVCGVSYALTRVLTSANLDEVIVFCISCFIFFILSGIVLVYRHIANYHAYHHYLRDDVLKIYKQYTEKMQNISNPNPVDAPTTPVDEITPDNENTLPQTGEDKPDDSDLPSD